MRAVTSVKGQMMAAKMTHEPAEGACVVVTPLIKEAEFEEKIAQIPSYKKSIRILK